MAVITQALNCNISLSSVYLAQLYLSQAKGVAIRSFFTP